MVRTYRLKIRAHGIGDGQVDVLVSAPPLARSVLDRIHQAITAELKRPMPVGLDAIKPTADSPNPIQAADAEIEVDVAVALVDARQAFDMGQAEARQGGDPEAAELEQANAATAPLPTAKASNKAPAAPGKKSLRDID